MSKQKDDIMFHKVVTFWKVVNFIAVVIFVFAFVFFMALDEKFWPLATGLTCATLVVIGITQINEAEFTRKSGKTCMFPFNRVR